MNTISRIHLAIRDHRQRKQNTRAYWQSVAMSLEEAAQGDGPINDEYCWTHKPGGWTCAECREAQPTNA